MELVMMSERELNRVAVLSKVIDGRRSAVEAASLLGMSVRQVHRLLAKFRDGGAGAIGHKDRGKPSNNHKLGAARAEVISLIRDTHHRL